MKIKEGKKTPNELAKESLSQKLEEDRGVVERGNYDGCPNRHVVKQMAYELREEATLSDDEFTDICLHAAIVNNKYGPNTVFMRSETPFKLAWSTPQQLQYVDVLKAKCKSKKMIGFIDSTGK